MYYNVFPDEIKIGNVPYKLSYHDDVAVDRTDLDTEFENHARKFSYYAYLSELAEHEYNKLKDTLGRVYAVIDAEKRQEANEIMASMKASGDKFKFTEKMYESQVITDPRYQTLQNELHEAGLTLGILTVMRQGFQQRKDMLSQMGMNSRVGEPRVDAQQTQYAKSVLRKG